MKEGDGTLTYMEEHDVYYGCVLLTQSHIGLKLTNCLFMIQKSIFFKLFWDLLNIKTLETRFEETLPNIHMVST